ncbi:MAG: hypothetical protein JNM91_14680, partial [Flavobacteriales bacterium]|nr:hypothetical protein [Flavobacteriales bacterium]
GLGLRVVGKGNRAREVPVPDAVTSALADYFARRGLARDLEHADNTDAYRLGKTAVERSKCYTNA